MPTETTGQPVWHWLALLLAVVALGLGVWAWRKYDPFFTERPAMKATVELMTVARKRPLSADEFAEALALLDSGEPAAQLPAIAVLQLEVERAPIRRETVVAALKKVAQSAEPRIAKSATTVAARLTAKPPE